MITGAALPQPLMPRPKIVRWFSARPRIADVLIILVCTVPTVIALVLVPPAHAWLGYLCAAGVAVAFWWRREHPIAVLLIAVFLAAFNPISREGISVAVVESFFGIYTVASLTRLRTAVLAYLAGEAVIFCAAGVAILLGLRETFPAVLFQPVTLAALAIGVAVRASRDKRTSTEEMIALREERAASAERARITAEMHDVVAHSVTVMIALAGGARAGWDKHPERARNALEQLGIVGAQALEEMQRILRLLRDHDRTLDTDLESSGYNLPPMDELVGMFRAAGLPVEIEGAATAETVEPALRTTVYRIVQEALTNALRYARGVTHVEVSIRILAGCLIVTVTDNGSPGPSTESLGAGVGLRAMQERTAAFHGTLEAGPIPTGEPTPGTGWRVRATLPLKDLERT